MDIDLNELTSMGSRLTRHSSVEDRGNDDPYIAGNE